MTWNPFCITHLSKYAMVINFKKLKSQIKPLKPEANKNGFIFLATDEQKRNFVDTIVTIGSKHRHIKFLVSLIKSDEDWRNEFSK